MSALRASVLSPSSGSLRDSLHMDVRVSRRPGMAESDHLPDPSRTGFSPGSLPLVITKAAPLGPP